MALIQCPECGKEISDTSNHCIHCGYIMSDNAKVDSKKTNKKMIVIIVVLAFIVAFIAISLLIKDVFIPASKYSEACQLLENQQFDEAIDIFTELGNYKDSKGKIREAENEKKIIEKLKIKEKLKKASEECTSLGTTLSSDGLSLFIDSEDSEDVEALMDILTVLEELNIPDSVWDEMGTTTALMGKQTQVCGDFEISWTYHPDNGLDVLIKIVE